jgi:hypothetical protein
MTTKRILAQVCLLVLLSTSHQLMLLQFDTEHDEFCISWSRWIDDTFNPEDDPLSSGLDHPAFGAILCFICERFTSLFPELLYKKGMRAADRWGIDDIGESFRIRNVAKVKHASSTLFFSYVSSRLFSSASNPIPTPRPSPISTLSGPNHYTQSMPKPELRRLVRILG